jgi:hypothetical protein
VLRGGEGLRCGDGVRAGGDGGRRTGDGGSWLGDGDGLRAGGGLRTLGGGEPPVVPAGTGTASPPQHSSGTATGVVTCVPVGTPVQENCMTPSVSCTVAVTTLPHLTAASRRNWANDTLHARAVGALWACVVVGGWELGGGGGGARACRNGGQHVWTRVPGTAASVEAGVTDLKKDSWNLASAAEPK